MIKAVPHWELWWRKWSTWTAGLFAAITASVTAYPSLLLGLVAYFPGEYRAFLCGVVAIIVFVIPIVVTHLCQPKLVEKREQLDAKT